MTKENYECNKIETYDPQESQLRKQGKCLSVVTHTQIVKEWKTVVLEGVPIEHIKDKVRVLTSK